jgi:two-component system response regulator YesN
MPQGTGLDLLSWIREKGYDIQTIFLTNYADFSYAQKAIELQSLEYYLKPIAFDKLTLILQKAIEKVHLTQQAKKDASIANTWEETKANISHHFWDAYIKHGENYTKQVLFTHLKNNHLPYKTSDQFIIILFDLFPYTLSEKNEIIYNFSTEKKLFSGFETAFKANFCDVISTYDILLEANNKSAQFIAIINCSEHMFNERLLKLKYTYDKLISAVKQQLNSSLSCYIGVPCTFENFHFILKHLQEMNEDIIDCRNRVFCLNTYTPVLSDYQEPNLVMLDKHLSIGNRSLFVDTCHDYILALSKADKLNYKVMTSFRFDITQLIFSFLKENGISAHKLLPGTTNDLLMENSARSIEDMIMYITFLVNTAIGYAEFSTSQKSVASIICDFIDVHYAEDINRNSLAEIVYLDQDYTARLFKKEKGISLGNYIIQKRVTIAKDLLMNTDLPVNLISDKVGYGNYSYFTKLFKKETGYTPVDYRRLKNN